MLNRKKIISIKNTAKHCLLAFTLLLSFFVISGYVNSSRPAAGTIDRGVLSVEQVANKRGISYKRASLAFSCRAAIHLDVKETSAARISLNNKLIAIRYLHLRQLFLFRKSISNFQFTPLLYPADKDHPVIG